jgi:hypothetical protein
MNQMKIPKNNLEDPKDRKWKIDFIKGSSRKTHIYNDLHKFSDRQLNDQIREIVQALVRKSVIMANAYLNGMKRTRPLER